MKTLVSKDVFFPLLHLGGFDLLEILVAVITSAYHSDPLHSAHTSPSLLVPSSARSWQLT